jgi:hypothetical protein
MPKHKIDIVFCCEECKKNIKDYGFSDTPEPSPEQRKKLEEHPAHAHKHKHHVFCRECGSQITSAEAARPVMVEAELEYLCKSCARQA